MVEEDDKTKPEWECQLTMSPAWLLSTNIRKMDPFLKGFNVLGGMASTAPA
jgi:hypothetical protein